MNIKTFLKQFTVAGGEAETDLDEICHDSLEANEVLREIVERAFKLGVAEGLSCAECAITRALGLGADEMDNSGYPALQVVRQMSARCYRAATEPGFDGNVSLPRSTRRRKSRTPDAGHSHPARRRDHPHTEANKSNPSALLGVP